MSKMYAIPHDGTMDGNSIFIVPGVKIPYHGREDIADMRVKFVLANLAERKRESKENEKYEWHKPITDAQWQEFNEDQMQDASKIEGFWIVEEETLDLLQCIWEVDTDSAYGSDIINACAKRLAHCMSVEILGSEPRGL